MRGAQPARPAWTRRRAGASAPAPRWCRRAAEGDAPVYGVNTGFGKLANSASARPTSTTLQLNLIRSHSVGVGEPLAPAVVRLMLALKAASLARGHSGVRRGGRSTRCSRCTTPAWCRACRAQGSVGASGDLAPLAHMTLALMGEGEMLVDGRAPPGRCRLLQRAGIAPLALQAKEGLALINGTQTSHRAGAARAVQPSSRCCEAALVVGALTVDAARGSDGPFDPRIHALRGQPGQIDVAAVLPRAAGRQRRSAQSPRRAATTACRTRTACAASRRWWAPASTSCATPRWCCCARPMPSPTTRWSSPTTAPMISGGNFHAEPVALAADAHGLAIAEVGAIAERRIAMLIDAGVSRLPPFLTADAGLNSGFMIAHVTAAALASENKSLAHPASVDSLPTSANQEDHVSMATFAARRLQPMIANVAHILGIELLAAAQGIEFLRPLRSSAALEPAHALLRARARRWRRTATSRPTSTPPRRWSRDGSLARILRTLPGLPALWTPA